MPDAHANDPLLGQLFHDYRVEERLAEGGMGAVYLCRHLELPHVRKILKVVLTQLMHERTRAAALERFEREATALSHLHHRYIAPIDGIGVVAGQRCILMPFLEGRTLEQVLHDRGGRLAPHEALHVAAQIARALDYAHRHGIVHRDLKPGNVFVTPTEDDSLAIKVIDFGIARQVYAPETATPFGPLGTPLYMAVEQFEDPGNATPLADVCALAIMVYEMTTGGYPWGTHDNAITLYKRQRQDRPAPVPAGTMPPGWEEFLGSALAPDPGQRPQSMHALVYPLARMLPAGPGHKSGLDILRAVARRWADSLPEDETLRGGPAVTGAWIAASASGAWLAATTPEPSGTLRSWPAPPPLVRTPRAWGLALLGMITAVLAAIAVLAIVAIARGVSGIDP